MKIDNEKQVFNLMDTNGRRKDVINALQGYLSILDNITGEWDRMPNSMSQYLFYKKAIELSPDVFSKHKPYDDLLSELNKNLEFKRAIDNDDLQWIQSHKDSYMGLIKQFDEGIEDRARHYTSTLVKLGFATFQRKITEVGQLLLGKRKFLKDDLEKFLPVDNVNIIYLRQLLKLRVYKAQWKSFYSPFLFALYILLKKDRMTDSEFFELVQGFGPYSDFNEIDNFIDNYQEGDIVKKFNINIPMDIGNSVISETIFREYFKNNKSSKAVDIYLKFYKLLYTFNNNRNITKLEELLQYYKNNKNMLNKAFGCGKNIFMIRTNGQLNVKEFLREHKVIFTTELNKYIYVQFELSKRLDQIKEYSDTTRRIFRATGIISFEKGYVQLAYKELCKHIFKEDYIKKNIIGEALDCEECETMYYSNLCSVMSLSEILSYSSEELLTVISAIQDEFRVSDIKQIAEKISINRKREFTEFVNKKYPMEKVIELLGLFNNRSNDREIKKYVSSDATVPTIYEFIVGLAWYYFSGKRIDIFNSYNLTLSANFEPLMHAGGGQGDIVIYEDNKVVMLEATLMNTSNQKRGEWEPVLRHSVNLKVNEELSVLPRQVTTFFIADEFDVNTINIWKAVAAVPMQSSVDKNNYTYNVVIMPINSAELCILMRQPDKYDEIIDNVHTLFEVEKNNFDLNWRDDFIRRIV